MASRYQDVNYGDFGAGIDQLSPENKIKDGYSQELVNIDPTPEGSLVKRKGTQLYGSVPVRVNRMEYFRVYPDAVEWDATTSYPQGTIVSHADGYYTATTATTIGAHPNSTPSEWAVYEFKGELCFYLDPTVDVLALRSSPIFVYGRTTDCQAGGDFDEHNMGMYYPSFTTDLRRLVSGAEQGEIILEGLAHGQGLYQTPLLSVSTDVTSLSNYQIYPDRYAIDKTTFDLTANITPGVDVETFLVTKSRNFSAGLNYVQEFNIAPGELQDGIPARTSAQVPASLHGLDNFNIIVECFLNNEGNIEKIIPDGYEIDALGNVEVYFKTFSTLSVAITLSAAPASNIDTLALQVPVGSPLSTNYTVGDIESAFPFLYLFVESPDGSREFVYHDTVEVDTVNDRATIYLTKYEELLDGGTVDRAFNTSLIWDYATLVSNKLCVEASDPVVENFNLEVTGKEHEQLAILTPSFRYSTNEANDNNYVIGYDEVEINAKTSNVKIIAKNQTEESFDAIAALKKRDIALASVQQFRYEGDSSVQPNSNPQSLTITRDTNPEPAAGTHQFEDMDKINVEIFRIVKDEAGEDAFYYPIPFFESEINEVTGDIVLTGTTNEELELMVLLYQSVEKSNGYYIDSQATENIKINNLDGNFPLAQVYQIFPTTDVGVILEEYTLWDETQATTGGAGYLQNDVVFYQQAFYIATAAIPTVNNPKTPNNEPLWELLEGRARQHIYADRNTVDSVSATMSIDITNNTTAPIVVSVIYDYAAYNSASTCIPVTGSVEDGYVDNNPQMTIYGLPHRQLYSASEGSAPGHVTHIDVYRAEAEERAICGLGGNIFAAYESFEAAGSSLAMPSLYPDLRGRADSTVAESSTLVIGPAFAAPIEEAARTSGVIRSTSTQANTLKVESAIYNQANNTIVYTIPTPERAVFSKGIATQGEYITGQSYAIEDLVYDSEFNIYKSLKNSNTDALTVEASWKKLSQVITSNDYITIENMGYSVHNGSFRVVSVKVADVTDEELNVIQKIEIEVINPDALSSDFNLTSAAGRAGVFTDTIPLDSKCKFLPGDRIRSAAWGEEQFLTAIDTSSVGVATGNLRIEGLYREIIIPDGLPLVADRTSRIIPLRTINFEPTTEGLVAGDVLSYSEIARELRAKYVNPRDDIDIKVLVNLGEAFVTIPEAITTNWLSTGQYILLLDEGVFRGEYQITEIFDQLSFTFNTDKNNNQSSSGASLNLATNEIEWTGHGLSVGEPLIFVQGTPAITGIYKDTIYFVSSDGYTENSFKLSEIRGATPLTFTGDSSVAVNIQYSGSTRLVGNNMEVDEELSWADSLTSVTSFDVKRRWIPVEAPDNGFKQIQNNYYRHLDFYRYDDQPTLRSTMVNDNMYFTNGEDAVQKFDGQNITRAGLFRWQPHLYLTKDESSPSIVVRSPSLEADIKGYDNEAGVFTVTKGTQQVFDVGADVVYTREVGGKSLQSKGVIEKLWDAADLTESYIQIDFGNDKLEAYATASNFKLKQVGSKYRYYYRMNLEDANNNVISSAVTGAEDATISLLENSSIRHLIVRPSFLDNFDFNRLEIEIYRTKANQVGPFYKVGTVSPEWNRPGGAYVQFVDRLADAVLKSTDLDTLSVLSGQELGQTWTGPLRAKYITSASNSLVLANVRDWPKITISFQRYPNATPTQSSYDTKSILLRKSNLDEESTTDNYNRMRFQFVGDKTEDDENAVDVVKSIDWTLLDTNAETNEAAITSTAHDLSEGDWVYLFYREEAGTLSINPRLGGHYQVSSVLGPDQFAISLSNVAFSDILANPPTTVGDLKDVDSYVAADSPSNIPVWLGADALYGTVTGEIRKEIDINNYVFLRLANAINSAQAVCRLEDFRPWVTASAGGEITGAGIILETPYVTENTLEVVAPGFVEQAVYINGIKRLANDQVQALARIFPSRLLVSFAKHPEIFDLPTATLETDSLSAIDVNPADGQQITGVIPFFGDSAFGSAQKDGVLLVFKTASVYLVNINSKRQGQNAVQKLDTRGLGCTAPFSIAPTQKGVMFANQSGIYRITNSFTCEYIGRRVERIWQEKVDTEELDVKMFGHYYPLGNQYKLSVPYTEDGLSHPNRTLVYNTTREYSADGYRDGSWTTYDNIPSVGFANMLRRAIFATPTGEVFTLRDTGEKTDYRDGDEPIVATAILRALDFGAASVRKAIGTVNIQFKPDSAGDNSPVVESATDLVNLWEPLDLATVSRRKGVGNVSTRVTQQLSVIQFTADRRKGVYFQLRISNSNLDEGLNVAGISLMVKGLSATSIQQARDTRG